MFAIILSFIKSHWQTVLIASGVFSVLATISLQHLEIKHADAKLAECRAESVTLENANRALVASIESQNAAVASLAAKSKSRKAASAKALAAARARAGEYAEKAQRIESLPDAGSDCGELRSLINRYAGGVQ